MAPQLKTLNSSWTSVAGLTRQRPGPQQPRYVGVRLAQHRTCQHCRTVCAAVLLVGRQACCCI